MMAPAHRRDPGAGVSGPRGTSWTMLPSARNFFERYGFQAIAFGNGLSNDSHVTEKTTPGNTGRCYRVSPAAVDGVLVC